MDLNEVIGTDWVRGVSFIFDNKAVVDHHAGDFVPPENPDDFWGTPKEVSLVDLESEEVSPFNGFEGWGSCWPTGSIDGENYFCCNKEGDGFLLRQISATEYEEVFPLAGGTPGGWDRETLRQLW